jgi:hypothetical protein
MDILTKTLQKLNRSSFFYLRRKGSLGHMSDIICATFIYIHGDIIGDIVDKKKRKAERSN